MRTTGLLVALGATLNFAFADVVCKPEALHYKPRIITATEKTGFASSIKELCSASKADKFILDRSGSTVFTITRTQETFNSDDCKAQFNSIIDACVLGINMGGGRLVADGLTLEIYTDASKNEAKKPRAPASKKTTTKPAAKKPAAKKPAAEKPKAKKPKAKKPTAKEPAAGKKTPGNDATTPKEQACTLKGAKGKKPSKQTLRSLVSKILRRSTPTGRPKSPASSGDETFFGFQNEIGISKTDLSKMVEAAYNEIAAKNRGLTLLVAALYVPNKGVYYGTVPHGVAVQQMKAVAPSTAPALWETLEERVIKDPTKSPSLYHAEDAAIWHTYNKGEIPKTSRFPRGSIIVTWGKISGGGQATKIPACDEKTSNIDRNCQQNLESIGISEA